MREGSGQWSGASKSVFCFALCAMFFAVWFPVYAQQPAKLPKIGWLAVRPASAAFAIESFQREFGELGYVEGKNIVFEYRYAEGKSTDSPRWPRSWSVSKLTCLSPPIRPLP